MPSVVVDTDVFCLLFKGDSRGPAYASDLDGKRMCVSFMTVAELLHWAVAHRWGIARRRALQQALERYIVLPYDLELAETWAAIAASRSRAGRLISCADCWIAATAVRHGLPLVTHNASDFAGIDGLRILTRA